MPIATLLVVDDEHLIRWSLRERLERAGYRVVEASNGKEALERAKEGIHLALLDLMLPDTDGMSLLRQLKQSEPELLAIMMTGHASVQTAVESIKEGAYHYLTKPMNLDELPLLLEKALETTLLRREVSVLRTAQSEAHAFSRIIGESPSMQNAKAMLRKVAGCAATAVLLTGESGTGKDLAAKAIHYNSDRASRPFMNITCSALPEPLLESELFGHERGSFTDAKIQKKGLLELADGGTVFLDEIGEMSPTLQAKLLRFLEEKAFKRVGGAVDIKVDVRIIAATNRNLEEAVARREFREDLYYRIRVLPVILPPLRDRPGDIPLLVQAYIDVFNRDAHKNVRGLLPDARAALEAYAWPGNVRELRNAVERAVLLCEGEALSANDFLMVPATRESSPGGYRLPPQGINFEELERDLLEQALERVNGNRSRAAHLLGMSRDQIRYRMEKFHLVVRGGRGRKPGGAPPPPRASTDSVEPRVPADGEA